MPFEKEVALGEVLLPFWFCNLNYCLIKLPLYKSIQKSFRHLCNGDVQQHEFVHAQI